MLFCVQSSKNAETLGRSWPDWGFSAALELGVEDVGDQEPGRTESEFRPPCRCKGRRVERACYRGSYCSAGRCGVSEDRDGGSSCGHRRPVLCSKKELADRKLERPPTGFTIHNTLGLPSPATSRSTITITPTTSGETWNRSRQRSRAERCPLRADFLPPMSSRSPSRPPGYSRRRQPKALTFGVFLQRQQNTDACRRLHH